MALRHNVPIKRLLPSLISTYDLLLLKTSES